MGQGLANQLVRDIENRIASGALAPGERLDPVRETAERLSLAPNTVASAYRRLRERGVVVGRGRQGTVVAQRPLVAPVLSQAVPLGVVDAMTGNPDPVLLPDLGPALAHAAAGPGARYGDHLVDPDLVEVGRANFEADSIAADHFTVVSGAMDAVERLLQAQLRPGDRVGVEDPGYASVHQLVTGLGFEPVPVAIDAEGVVPQALNTALVAGLDALVVTPRSHNPTGAAFSPNRAEALDMVLAEYPATMVIQDDHAGALAGVDLQALSCDRPRWAVVRSVAKSLGPDLRLAFVVGDRDTVDRVEGRLQVGPGWVSHLLQRAVAYLLVDPATQQAVVDAAATYCRRRQRMISLLAEGGVESTARSGLHVWVPVSDEQSVVAAVRNRGFAVRAGAAYRLASPPAIRITTAALNQETIEELAGILVDVFDPSSAISRIA